MREIDLYLFRLINGTWCHPSLDPFFRMLSNWDRVHLFVLAALAIAFFFVSHRWKYRFALMLLAVALADILASDLKVLACRTRPYLEHPQLVRRPENYGYNSTSYSMPSNHAANMFAAALVAVVILRRKRYGILFFVPAILVGYSRVYLGVHYPSDVLAGYGVGALAAGIVLLTDRLFPALIFDETGRAKSFNWSGLTALLLTLLAIFRYSALGHGEVEAGRLEAALFPEEARQWIGSNGPPGLPALMRLSTWIVTSLAGTAPITRVFALRALAVTFALGTQLMGCMLAWRAYRSQRAVFFTALTLALMPLYALNAQLCVPHSAALFFWAVGAFALHGTFCAGRTKDWLLAALALIVGMAFCPEVGWLVPGLMLYLIFAPERWAWIDRKEPNLFVAWGFAVALVLVSFKSWFPGTIAIPATVAGIGPFLALQAVAVSPVLLLGMLGCVGAALMKKSSGSERLLAALGIPVFAGAILRSYFVAPPQDASSELLSLAAPAYFTWAVMASGRLSAAFDSASKSRRAFAWGAAILGAAIPMVMYYYISEPPAFPRVAKNLKFVPPQWDPAFPSVGYDNLATVISQSMEGWPEKEKAFVIVGDTGSEDDLAAELTFFMTGAHDILIDVAPEAVGALKGRNAIVVMPGFQTKLKPGIARLFETVGDADYRATLNKGLNYKGFTLFRCEKFGGKEVNVR